MKKILSAMFLLVMFLGIFACNSPISDVADEGELQAEDYNPLKGREILKPLPAPGSRALLPVDAYEEDDTHHDAKKIVVNAKPQTRNFHNDAIDWAYFVAEAGKQYVIETDCLKLGGSKADTKIWLYCATCLPNGSHLAYNDDIAYPRKPGSRIVWTCETPGWYYIKITSYSNDIGEDEDYMISVVDNDFALKVYQHHYYGGKEVHLGPGRYNLAALKNLGIENDWITALQVNSSKYDVTIFEHSSFSGATRTITENYFNLYYYDMDADDNWNDEISSIVINRK